MHTASILHLSADRPRVVEVVDSEERLARALRGLDAMMGGGLVTLERVRAVRYAHGAACGDPGAG